MTTRLLQEAQPPYSETIKRKMRTLFRQGLGLARNASEATIANVIGVQPRLLYNYLAQDYNNYVRAENERILAQRRRQAQERRRRLQIQRNIVNALPINQIQTTFDYPKNKFHIRDHTYKFDPTIIPLVQQSTNIDVITENATRKMYLQLLNHTSTNTYFRIWLNGDNARISTRLLSFGEYTYEMFLQDIDKMQQSEVSNSIFNIEFTIQLRTIPQGSGMLDTTDIPQFLKKRNGITLIYNDDEKCGQRCLVCADQKNLNNFKKDCRKKGRENYFDNKLNKLCDELKHYTSMSHEDFNKYAQLRKRQVVVLGHSFNVLYETEHKYFYKVYIFWDGEINHYHYIHDINAATNDSSRNSKWCFNCNKSYRVDSGAYSKHKCVDNTCYFCKEKFDTDELKQKHFHSPKWFNCDSCNCFCPNASCYEKHIDKCKGKSWRCEKCKKYILKEHKEDHICGEIYCSVCNIHHQDKKHRCWIQPLEKKDEKEKDDIYAFDFESKFDKEHRHIVNYCVVMKLYSEEKFICETIEEFVKYVLSKKSSTFIAHNGKAYDTWLVHKYLIQETNKRPTKLILAGNKIMYMKIGSIRFIDSLNHIAQGLSSFPKIFGIKEMKKGYFPYTFNTDENQNYIGQIPPIEYFNPDEMMEDKRKDFMEWYNKQNEYVYNFKKELDDYCCSDVDILKRSMEIYIDEGIALNGLNPIKCSTIASYAMKVYRTNYLKKDTICVLKKDEYDFCKRGFFGGRTEVFKLHKKFEMSDVEKGKYIDYADIQSLYPTVQYYDQLPCGIPKWDEDVEYSKEYLENHFGYYEVDIVCPKNIHIPLLPEKKDMKLNFDLVDKDKAVYTSVELLRAVEIGYEIKKIYKVLYFDRSDDLFKGYVRNFLKIKTECGGYSGDDIDEYIQRYYDACGVLLEKEKIKANKGKKLLAKILLNSLWGKFGQKDNMPTTEYITDPSKWFRMLRDNNAGKITLQNETLFENGNTMYVQYVSNETAKSSLNTTNVALAGFTTSQARLRLYQELYKLDKRVIYCDTDSIVYEHDDSKYNIPISDVLGGWELEADEKTKEAHIITEFVGFAPKSYAFKTTKDYVSVKCKGITLHYNNSKKINFDSLIDLVYGKIDKLETKKMEFIKGKEFIKTQYTIKEINFERPKFKREINSDNTTTARQ